ncbi:MAG: M15 family metallopeptidase [Lachnospiraceae bacterium]|nr:M15 family metallopeptidase [Lachnospiraceae bacterium]
MFIIVHHLGNVYQSSSPRQPAPVSDTGASDTETNSSETHTPAVSSDADETSWCLILANKWNPIPTDYKVELITLSNGKSVDSRIYPALQKMFDDARSHNIYPIVASGYRTTEKQQSLMDEKIGEYKNEGYSADEAKSKAETWVAIPGTSEHQLGIAVDINADGVHSTGDEVYKWLDENAYKYGFIHRYPSDKTDITGVINEPWHYRYVGITTATEIQRQGVCLEEYLHKVN